MSGCCGGEKMSTKKGMNEMKSCSSDGDNSHEEGKTNWMQVVAVGMVVLLVLGIVLRGI